MGRQKPEMKRHHRRKLRKRKERQRARIKAAKHE